MALSTVGIYIEIWHSWMSLQLWWVIYGLQGYIQDAQFSPSDWLAPGRPLDLQKTKDAKTRLLAPKRIADVVEALIGNAKDANFM